MELTKEIIDALVKYNELNKKAKEIENEMKAVKPILIDFIKGELNGEPLECEGIRAVLTSGSKKTLVGESVEKMFNIQLTEDCYKVCNYPILKVSEVK